MISVEEAQRHIFENVKTTVDTFLNLDQPDDRHEVVLREPLFADRNFPPFHRVCMDGIAFSFADWERGCRRFSIEGCHNAGDAIKALSQRNGCFEVMTGAILPHGCDAVVRYEDVQISGNTAFVSEQIHVSPMQHVHQEGSDYKKGDLLVSEGAVLRSPQWAIAASIGAGRLKVASKPKLAVVSTGNELVDIGKEPKEHQIRRSNSYGLLSSLRSSGFDAVSVFHLMDHRDVMLDRLGEIVEKFDVIILSGGVSMGKLDLVPAVLLELNIGQIFHKVRQRPGKPLWFGKGLHGQLVFGLPGNPVSTLTCFHRYVLPALRMSLGKNRQTHQQFAVLETAVEFKPQLTYFLPVRIRYLPDGTVSAKPVQINGSGDFATLAQSDGFLELPEARDFFPAGTTYPFWTWT